MTVSPHPLLPLLLATRNLPTTSMDLPVLDVSINGIPYYVTFWCLASFTEYPCCSACQPLSLFLGLSNIPMYGWTTLSSSIGPLRDVLVVSWTHPLISPINTSYESLTKKDLKNPT